MEGISLETSLLIALAVIAVGLLVAVTGGVAYLTALEWRDRRRLDRERREQRRR